MTPTPVRFRPLSRSLLSIALAGCMAVAAPAALAQSTAATIRGQVMVDSAPATEARVTATNTATGLTRSVGVGASGSYTLAGLPPGTYRLQVEAGGQSASQTVTVAVGQTATLDLGVGGLAENATAGEATDMATVQVTAAAVEPRTSEVATYISRKQIESLPQGTRNFLAFADTVPGMLFQQDGNGNTKLRSGGQSANAINIFIDGIGQKSYTLPGGVPGQDTSRGNPFPQSAIGEYKVITSNYKAEYDQVSSAAIVAATRSGTNEFEGGFFWDRTGSDWRARTPAEERSGEKVDSKEEQYGVSFGGPLLQDRLHFFAAYEAKEYVTPKTLELGAPSRYDVSAVPPDLLAGLGAANSPFKQDLFFGKLSWSVNDYNLVELSAQVRDEEETIRNDGAFTRDRASNIKNEVARYDLRWQYSGERWLNDLHVTYEDTSWSPQPLIGGNGYVLTVSDLGTPGERSNTQTVVSAGAGSNNQDKGQKGYSIQNDLSFTGWEGHNLKMGVKFKQVDVNATERNFSNPQFYYDIDLSTVQPYRVEFGQGIPGTSQGFTTSDNKQFGIYVQDDWNVNDRLTLNLGVRWDYETTPAYEDHVTPADLAESMRAWPNWQNSDIDIENYISTGNNRDAYQGAWQPRLGFSYDFGADQRHVLFGGAGRSYDRNLFDSLQKEQQTISYAAPYRVNFVDADGVCRNASGCLPWDPAYLQPGGTDALSGLATREYYVINNDLKVPYSDQFSLGFRKAWEFGETVWNSEIAVAHIRSQDGVAIRLANRRPDGSFFPPGAQWGTPWDFDPPFGRLILVDNALETRTNTVLAKMDKPYTNSSGWGVTLAYTYTDAKRNSAEEGAAAFEYPDVTYYGWLPVAPVPRHRLVGTAIWDGPGGITWSGKVVLESMKNRIGTNCLSDRLPGDGDCFIDSYRPDGSVGLFQLDLAAAKVWHPSDDISFRVRADVLNVTDRRNWNAYDDWWGSDGVANANWGTHSDGIQLPTRTFKLSFGIDW
ncbi:TonB-dependent receptor [Luteimonas sp. 100069]|uniref:TonB-dependent receptor n=1 Tax=Luteimonas sp. 100069 TaxID=2006109 RepID=UPI000F4EA130|nr:TonB-dependent receptor [Luteimonas sp. 100069]RPD88615.1 TonB-dependent receptor [Luteimonas sp. 100069]